MNPFSNNVLATQKDNVKWPRQPSGILIMGKRQGTKKENKQLYGRIALAAALWYSAPNPKPYLMFVASDIHGPRRIPDTTLVKSTLINDFGIPADFLIMRQKSNCTLVEVRAVRTINRVYKFARIFAITHLYHAYRTQVYFNEVLPNAVVIPAHPEILNEIEFPLEGEELLKQIRAVVQASRPTRLDLIREQVIEGLLMQAHRLDPRGRLERRLAKVLRPGTL
ncbi:MAG: YdcF family protein [Anaerolineae bacterium]|nr:YdcF family protein [Anaerolineae bacterium]MCB9104578.1 YdcF family protein [Anaerolineales bacterium]